MLRFCSGVGAGVPDAISCAKPRMALSGVRSSWLMLERKSDFATVGLSAAALGALELGVLVLQHLSSRTRSASVCLRAVLSVPISR
jgi:hypothetical protein